MAKKKKGSRRKRTPAQRFMAAAGIWPLAPIRLAATAGIVNGASAIITGNDMQNLGQDESWGGFGSGTLLQLQQVWRPGSSLTTLGQRIMGTLRVPIVNAQEVFFSPAGQRRVLLPSAAPVAVFVVAKAVGVNKIIPPGIRRFVRLT